MTSDCHEQKFLPIRRRERGSMSTLSDISRPDLGTGWMNSAQSDKRSI